MNMFIRNYFFLFIILALVSCTGSSKPKDPHWGHESCALCRMSVSDQRYGVQLIPAKGRVRFYDDLNCAITHRNETPELKDAKLYVRPFGGEKWEEAKVARFQSGLTTPMGSGFGAVAEGGTLSFDEVEKAIMQKRK